MDDARDESVDEPVDESLDPSLSLVAGICDSEAPDDGGKEAELISVVFDEIGLLGSVGEAGLVSAAVAGSSTAAVASLFSRASLTTSTAALLETVVTERGFFAVFPNLIDFGNGRAITAKTLL